MFSTARQIYFVFKVATHKAQHEVKQAAYFGMKKPSSGLSLEHSKKN
jgi:hypothetical protein